MSEKHIDVTKEVTITVGGNDQEGIMHVRTKTDANFSKVWIDLMMLALGITGSSKARVIGHLISKRDANNRVHGSFDEIAEETSTGRMTVARTMKALQDKGLVERERDGVYIVSPDWIWDGHHHKRMTVLMEFQKLRHPESKPYVLTPTPEATAAAE